MTARNEKPSAFDIRGKEIGQIGIVVQDAVATARRFSEILGLGPWHFFDEEIGEASLYGEPVEPGAAALRLAFANLGAMEIELLEPLYGPSSHMDFLTRHGEGLHHVSLQGQEDYRDFRSALLRHGSDIEMEGVGSGPLEFIYMATQRQLGTIFEITSPLTEAVLANLVPWGTLPAPEISMVNLPDGEIVRIGIVTDDVDTMVKNYQEIFGIGAWQRTDLEPPAAACSCLHGVPVDNATAFHTRRAVAELGRLELELLEPVHGPSSHMVFLKKNGPGLYHLSLGAVSDHDEIVYSLRRGGIDVEMAWQHGEGESTKTLLATQPTLGALFEVERVSSNL